MSAAITMLELHKLTVDVAGIQARASNPECFADAINSSNHVVSPTLYRYDGNAYQPVGAGDTLQPYQAYWIKVFVATSVLIPTGK